MCFGQTIFSGRGEGLCRSYSSLALGFEAGGWNPANLAFSLPYSFNIGTIGIEYGSNIRLSDYVKLYYGGHLNDKDKEIFKRGEELSVLGEAQAISFSYKNIGIISYVYFHNSLTLPEDVVSLIFWGNEIDRTYSLEGIRGESHQGGGIVVSGGLFCDKDKRFAIGGGLKFIYGISYMGIKNSKGHLTTTFLSAEESKILGEGSIIYQYAEGGYGVGIDLGALYVFKNCFLSVSAINALTEIRWTREAKKMTASFKLEPTDLENFDPKTSLKWDTTEVEEAFSTLNEPRIDVNLGVKIRTSFFTIGTGYPQYLSIGGEIPFKFLRFRSGCAFVRSRLWSGFGVGVKKGLLHIDLGVRVASFSHFSLGFSISVIPDSEFPYDIKN